MNRTKAAIAGVVIAVFVLAFLVLRNDTPERGDEPVAARTSSATTPSIRKSQRRVSPASRQPGRIAGTITSADGESIVGAQVCAIPAGEEISEEDVREPRCTKSDASGHYVLSNLWPADYRPFASAEGFLATHYEKPGKGGRNVLQLGEGEEKTGVDLVLAPGGVEVLGKVLDIGGGYVAGASVYGWGGRRWESEGFSFTTTNDAGEFRLWLSEGRVSLSASAEGYSDGETEAAAPGQSIEILLTPEAVLAGRVVEADSDKPVSNVLVEAGHLGEGAWGFSTVRGSAFSDADGHFRITRLVPGRYKPKVKAEGAFGEVRTSVLLGLGQTADDLVIQLRPAFQLHGRVVAGADDTPCEEGSVSLVRSGSRDREYALCKEGEVRFDALLPGTYEVHVRCESSVARQEYDDVVITDGDLEGLVWQTEPGATLVGVVRNAAGDLVPSASVQVEGIVGDDPRAQRPRAWARTDTDGHYEATLAPGAAKVKVQAEGYAAGEDADVELRRGETSTVDLVLNDGGRIVGVVVDEAGAPVGNAEVSAYDASRRSSWSMFGGARTRDDGHFALEGVTPGSYRVAVIGMRAPGKSDDDVKGQKVEVALGKPSEVRLVVEARNHEITGQVLSDGKPVTDAYVAATRESDAAGARAGGRRQRGAWGRDARPVLTDMDGRFTLSKLSEGKYSVNAYRKGGGSSVQQSVPTGTDVRLEIDETGSVAGRVVATEMPPMFTIVMQDLEAAVTRRERFVGTDGQFLMADLPAGTYECSVQTSEGRAKTELVLAAGQTVKNVELTIEGLGTVRGQIVDLDSGEPVPGIQLMVTPKGDMAGLMQDRSKGKTNVSDAEGRFVVARVPTGDVQLIGFPVDGEQSSYEFLMRPLTLSSGEDLDLGALKMIKKKLQEGEVPGDTGFTIKEPGPGTAMVDFKLEVALVRPDGPAAGSGLKVGDVIVSVNDHQVSDDLATSWTLTQVPEGSTLRFGLERGETIEITLGPPRSP